MSANIVSPNHINALLNFAVRQTERNRVYLADGRVIVFNQTADLDFCAALLTRQNYASVNTRYESDYPAPEAAFAFDRTAYTPMEIVVACDGYDYQACETPDYFNSDAARIVAAIRRAAICAMPEYKTATTWSIA